MQVVGRAVPATAFAAEIIGDPTDAIAFPDGLSSAHSNTILMQVQIDMAKTAITLEVDRIGANTGDSAVLGGHCPVVIVAATTGPDVLPLMPPAGRTQGCWPGC